jgi:nucleotide-binding universal stress UspA family protein
MYERILVPVEHTEYDDVILRHVRKLARACDDASIVLIHVADGWAARNINQLDLRESEEMKSDREYIEAIADGLEKEGYEAEAILAGGDPAKEIAACAEREKCDLIAMATHGHHGIADFEIRPRGERFVDGNRARLRRVRSYARATDRRWGLE